MGKTIKLAALLLVITAAAWFGLRRTVPPSYVNLPPRATGPWVALGDSLTTGHGATDGHEYPTLLGQRLGLAIKNLGQDGDTTADGLRRLDAVVALRPRVVLLCLGGNDALLQTPREETFRNLAAIIDRLHPQGAFVVLIGIRSATLRDKNEEHFERLANEKRVLYVPNFLSGLLADPRLMSDTIHPNDEGYARIAERLEGVLRPLLPQLRSGPDQTAAGSGDAERVANGERRER
jgi:lysophospholipase L1-like esterase